MYNSYEISNVIKLSAQNKNVTVKKLLEDCNINKGFIYDLEHKLTYPSCDKVARIADYLDCSVDYLLGRTNEPSLTANIINGNITDSAVVQDSHHNNVTINGSSERKLTDEETELLRLFNFLDVRRRTKILDLAFTLEEEAKAENF